MVGTAVDGFVNYGLPWMGRKAVEMGRYGASDLMRNKNLQKKAVNYGINKRTPFIQDFLRIWLIFNTNVVLKINPKYL